LFNNAGAGKH